MTTFTTWLAAPTGSPARGGVDARPALAGGVAARVRDGVCRNAAVFAVKGSGLSASGTPAGLLGVPVSVDATGLTTVRQMTYIENNGTTFGYLSSRRPSS